MRCFATLAATFALCLAFVPPTWAADSFVRGEFLVKWKPGALRAATLAAVRGRVVREHRFVGVALVAVEDETALAKLRRDPGVLYAEPNARVRACVLPDDPAFGALWALRNTGQTGGTAGADIEAASVWNAARGDPAVRIGILDTGVDWTHPDLAANIWTNPGEIPGNSQDDDGNGYVDDVHGWDVVNGEADPRDDFGHGTHVAGTIAAVGDNGIGVCGVAWRASLVPIKFLDATGNGTTEGAIAALGYALQVGVALTNNSWSGGPYSQALRDAIAAAGAANQLFVAAAGNSASNNDLVPVYPASYDEPCIVVVAATDHADQLASFSNFGSTSVDLGAPGVDILSCMPNGGYTIFSGTSMATPHVTGVAALLYGSRPDITLAEVRARILARTQTLPSLQGRCVTQGRLDAFAAVVDPDPTPPGAIGDLAILEPGSTTMRLGWTATGDDGGVGRAAFYELRFAPWPIDAANFDVASALEIWDVQPAGASESHEVDALDPATPYWFALRARDESENPGPISNVVAATTLGAPRAQVLPASESVTLAAGQTALRTLEVHNIGLGTLDYVVATPDLVPFVTHGTRLAQLPPPALLLPKSVEDRRLGPPLLAGHGGPDALGVRWDDSDELGGPTFGWIDIAGVGTPIPLVRDDQTIAGIPIGFSFPFYGYAFEHVNVTSNGTLSFTSTRNFYLNQPLPNTVFGVSENLIAPFWDDLDFTPAAGNARAWFHSDGTRFIVQYSDVPHYSPPGASGPYTFEVILFPSGEIRFQYLAVGVPAASATIGIQDYSRTVGTQVAFNAPYARAGLAVRITPVPQWVVVLDPAAGRVPAGTSRQATLRFDSTGLHGGVYEAQLRIFVNDPVEDPVVVPLHLEVFGAVSDAASGAAGDRRLQLEGANPVRRAARFRLQVAPGALPFLHIYDARGRLLSTLRPETSAATEVQYRWDGRDASGADVAVGAYWARGADAGPPLSVRFLLVR